MVCLAGVEGQQHFVGRVSGGQFSDLWLKGRLVLLSRFVCSVWISSMMQRLEVGVQEQRKWDIPSCYVASSLSLFTTPMKSRLSLLHLSMQWQSWPSSSANPWAFLRSLESVSPSYTGVKFHVFPVNPSLRILEVVLSSSRYTATMMSGIELVKNASGMMFASVDIDRDWECEWGRQTRKCLRCPVRCHRDLSRQWQQPCFCILSSPWSTKVRCIFHLGARWKLMVGQWVFFCNLY